ncbi:response regulator [Gracilibacillus phocaeensis]|uniref:response regulator n=1 Tax=Gracilibacillus phocaeensis TaxID=2042304 RepID=UPI001031631F|nr:response regulator [Gracilibacillus phocaeensis]
MKVLIAEDEYLERKAMRKFLEDHFPDMHPIEEAPNGRMAIELAQQLEPDLILMDIKMPGINGLEAIAAIHHELPQTKFIMVTAYDTFDYAKQAMKFGVREYILKPGQKKEILQAIQHVKEEIAQARHIRQSQQELFLAKAIKGEDATALQRELFPQMAMGYFIQSNHPLPPLSGYVIQGQVGLYIGHQEITNAAILTQVRQLQLSLGDRYYIGIGKQYHVLSSLTQSYHQAKQALRQLITAGARHYGFASRIAEETSPVPAFLEAIRDGDEQRMQLQIEAILPVADVELFVQVKQITEAKGIQLPIRREDLLTEADWRDFIQWVVQEMKSYFQSQEKIEKARQYIDGHYHQSLSLVDMAVYAELSTNYFSNLFHEVTGHTFIDYLTEIRIQQAKERLQKHSASLKEISIDIGYKDPNYFSRVFKKHVGMSPKQYQQQIVK